MTTTIMRNNSGTGLTGKNTEFAFPLHLLKSVNKVQKINVTGPRTCSAILGLFVRSQKILKTQQWHTHVSCNNSNSKAPVGFFVAKNIWFYVAVHNCQKSAKTGKKFVLTMHSIYSAEMHNTLNNCIVQPDTQEHNIIHIVQFHT